MSVAFQFGERPHGLHEAACVGVAAVAAEDHPLLDELDAHAPLGQVVDQGEQVSERAGEAVGAVGPEGVALRM